MKVNFKNLYEDATYLEKEGQEASIIRMTHFVRSSRPYNSLGIWKISKIALNR